ncbi:cytochrome P450 [Streptomyces sp. Isolate_219]|uniref:cytochrome P450 n=1 Tax=Streptomyces sp. Isolate_219 TaxID=2950110 RepID=UPI0021C88398|nr:cytochrome P450 [Streptomyces sp. Isolate_219]MCR8577396.1 cytochrome P450 [Streptomyces sp. Isolate_219]
MSVPEHIPSLTSEFVSTAGGYRALREQAPLVQVKLPDVDTPMWLVTRYAAMKELLGDPRFVRDAAKLSDQEGPSVVDQMIEAYGLPPEFGDYNGILVLSDGDDHLRMRRIITRAFTARRIAALRPTLERLTGELHRTLSAGRDAELLEELCYPLACAAICELLGIVEIDQPQVRKQMMDAVSGEPGRLVPAFTSMVERSKALIELRRENPRDDLISTLLHVAQEEGDFDQKQITAIVMVLIDTGVGPAAHFLAEMILALLDHPDQVTRLRDEPELLRTRAVPELLRFTSSVPVGAPVYATEDLEFAGVSIKRGEAVIPGLLAANHDPHEYPDDALSLDVGRELGTGVGHMAFGHGPHYCIGAALARLEAEIVIDRLFLQGDAPQLAVDRDDLEFAARPGDGVHLTALPVRFPPLADHPRSWR